MKAKLTKRTIDAIQTPAHRLRVFDTVESGFLVDVTAQGKKTFYVRYRTAPGRAAARDWYNLGEYGAVTVEAARRMARDVKARVARGEQPARKRRSELEERSIAEHAEDFYKSIEARRKATTAKEYARMFKRDIIPALGSRSPKNVTREDIVRLTDSMRGRPYMANRVLATLGTFFGWCESHGYRDRHTNPAADVEPYPERARERFLSGAELARLGETLKRAQAIGVPPAPKKRRKRATGATAKHRPKTADVPKQANPVAIAVLRFLCLSGWREGEARTLRWGALDEDRGFAILLDTKTGRSLRPLGAAAWALLNGLKEEREDGAAFVFPGANPGTPITNITRTWQAVRHAAGLDDVRIHDLRHTAASVAAAGGLSLPLIGALLGHRNASTTQKYAHLADDPRRLAADRLAGDVAAAMSGTNTQVTPIRKTNR